MEHNMEQLGKLAKERQEAVNRINEGKVRLTNINEIAIKTIFENRWWDLVNINWKRIERLNR